MALTDKHVQTYCQPATQASMNRKPLTMAQDCQYLDYRTIGKGSKMQSVRVCTKLCGGKNARKAVGGYGGWWGGNGPAQGDNCAGYPLMLHIAQGIDVDGGPIGPQKP